MKESGYGKGLMSGQPEEEPEGEIQEQQLGDAPAAEAGLKQVAKNCGGLAAKYNAEGPPREIMPQFDPKRGGPDFKKVKGEFETGDINFSPGYVRKKAAE